MNKTELIEQIRERLGDATESDAKRMYELLDDNDYIEYGNCGLYLKYISDTEWMRLVEIVGAN